MLDQNLFIFPA